MTLLTLGLSHHAAPLDARERLAFTDADLPAALMRLRALPGVDEAAIVSTCNRTEILAVTSLEEEARLVEWWRRERGAAEGIIEKFSYLHRDLGSVTHSLRVASGLDSMVVGEPQILGQMKHSYTVASEQRALGPVLSRLFQHAFAVAKVVRSKTEIGAHPVSIAYAAVQMARRIFGDLSGQSALIIGAGDHARLIAQHLAAQGVARIVVANRNLERAEALAREVRGYAVTLADMPAHLAEAGLVIASTGARGYMLDREAVQRAIGRRRRKPVFMIDLAVPRDIAPDVAQIEDVYLYTVDDLRSVIEENLKLRGEAAQQAEVLVREYALEFNRWLESRNSAATIAALRQHGRAYRDEVLEKARRRLAAGEAPAEVLTWMADTLSNKLLHAPSAALRSADAVEQALLLSAARKLFDLPDEN
ncbi:MAG TPA: glutamyl-tRNA reductase [Nevskiaceae bacterium]|nr:glutamyl-tRNA reductase [Nevskiaceae bacterium]